MKLYILGNKTRKIPIWVVITVAAIVFVVAFVAIYYTVRAEDQTDISKDRFMTIQEGRYDMMNSAGMNPGMAMGRDSMDKSEFIDMQGDMYELMEKHNIHPGVMMGGCPVMMGGMMYLPWRSTDQGGKDMMMDMQDQY